MPTKLYLLNGAIIRSERVEYDEIRYTNIEITDFPVIENGQIIPLDGSETQKAQIASSELMMQKIFPKIYIVIVTIKKKKKTAVVYVDNGTIKLDESRGDKRFTSESEANAYAVSIYSK